MYLPSFEEDTRAVVVCWAACWFIFQQLQVHMCVEWTPCIDLGQEVHMLCLTFRFTDLDYYY